MQPFDETPQITINFTLGKQSFSPVIYFPVISSKFISGAEIQPQPFVATWKSTSNEIIEIFRSRNPIQIDSIRSLLQDGMGFYLVDGLDKNPAANVVCSGTLTTATKNQQGEFISMPVFARVETNAAGQGFRITIRSGHKLVSEAVKKNFLQVFGSDAV